MTCNSDRPKVALFSTAFDVYVSLLASALVHHCDVFLFVPKMIVDQVGDIINPAVHLRPFDKPSAYSPRMLAVMRELVAEISEAKPDVIHIQSGYIWLCPFLSYLRHLAPIVTTVHDVWLHLGEQRWVDMITAWLTRRASVRFIVHGVRLRNYMVSVYRVPPSSVYVIPHGEYSIYQKWSDSHLNEDKSLILFFGRASRYKGIEYLLRAQPLISGLVPGARIVLAGRGVSRYRPLVGRESPVEFHDAFIPKEAVGDYFRRATVVALPYVDATQSGVLSLAYGFRKPVVVTDVGSLPEVVDDGQGGFVVPPRDPVALAQRLTLLLSDRSLRQKMADYIDRKVRTELSWEHVAVETIKVYSSVM